MDSLWKSLIDTSRHALRSNPWGNDSATSNLSELEIFLKLELKLELRLSYHFKLGLGWQPSPTAGMMDMLVRAPPRV